MIKNKVNANINGALYEQQVLNKLVYEFSLKIMKYSEYLEKNKESNFENCILTNCPYKGYKSHLGWNHNNRSSRTEYVLCIVDKKALRIECKYQDTSGSVIDKLPSTIMDLQNYIPEDESFLVVGGSILERNIDYIKNLCSKSFPGDAVKKKNITVGKIDDLVSYIKCKM